MKANAKRQIEKQIFLMQYAMGEYDPTSNQAHDLASKRLKIWAKGYPQTDMKEIYALTGNSKNSPLGKQFKCSDEYSRIYDEAFVEYDSTEYDRLNGIIRQMTPLHSLMLDIHYIKRGGEKVSEYIERGATQFHSRTGYYKVLRLATAEFIKMGGI